MGAAAHPQSWSEAGEPGDGSRAAVEREERIDTCLALAARGADDGLTGVERAAALLEAGILLVEAERPAEAIRVFDRAVKVRPVTRLLAASLSLHTARAHTLLGQTAAALFELELSRRSLREAGRDLDLALCLREEARTLAGADDDGPEFERLNEAASIFDRLGERAELAATHLVAAEAFRRHDMHLRAVDAIEEATRIYGELDDPAGRLETRLTATRVAVDLGADDDILDELEDLRVAFERRGRPLTVAACDEMVARVLFATGEPVAALTRALLALGAYLAEADHLDPVDALEYRETVAGTTLDLAVDLAMHLAAPALVAHLADLTGLADHRDGDAVLGKLLAAADRPSSGHDREEERLL